MPFARRVTHAVAQLPHLHDAIVACPIDLTHIETVPSCTFLAAITNAAWRDGRPVHAIERLCQDARRRCLADPARSDKQIRMRQPILLDRVLERAHNMRLTDQIVERLWAIFSGK